MIKRLTEDQKYKLKLPLDIDYFMRPQPSTDRVETLVVIQEDVTARVVLCISRTEAFAL